LSSARREMAINTFSSFSLLPHITILVFMSKFFTALMYRVLIHGVSKAAPVTLVQCFVFRFCAAAFPKKYQELRVYVSTSAASS
jgi:hypothetical protein